MSTICEGAETLHGKVVEILKDIQSRDYSAEKAEVIEIPSDDVALLKSGPIQP